MVKMAMQTSLLDTEGGTLATVDEEEDEVWAQINNEKDQEQMRHQQSHRNALPVHMLRKKVFERVRGVAKIPQELKGKMKSRKTTIEMSTMAAFGLLEDDDGGDDDDAFKEWGVVKNLDAFFCNLYTYYCQKGLTNCVTSAVVNLFTLAFTIAFSTFLLVCLDWPKLMTCRDQATCKHFSEYISWDWTYDPTSTLGGTIVLAYTVVFGVYWIWCLVTFVINIKDSMKMSIFYTKQLKIPQKDLQTMQWNDVVSRVVEFHESTTQYKVQINKRLTAFDIASRIMRKDNYLVALFNEDLLDLTVPIPGFSKHEWLSKNLEWSIRFCLINYMFTDEFTIHQEFLKDVGGLKRRFFWIGILNLAVLPFSILFMMMHFIMKHAQDWHSKKSYLGPQMYSPSALWLFRDFNELPHFFEKRMYQSYEHAVKYQIHFPTTTFSILAKGAMYVSGAFVSVLLLFTILDEALLLYVEIGGRQLVFYSIIFSGIFVVARSIVPAPELDIYEPEEAMAKIAAYTHYFPPEWRNKCHTQEVRDSFANKFQYKAALFLLEIISTLFTPWILCVSLPRCVPRILEFIEEYTTEVPGIGAACAYSLYDFERFGDPRYGAKRSSVAQPHNRDMLPTGTRSAKNGKMEKSFITFKENHPDWQVDEEGNQLLNALANFAQNQSHSRVENLLASGLSLPASSSSLQSSVASLHNAATLEQHDDPPLSAKPDNTHLPPDRGLLNGSQFGSKSVGLGLSRLHGSIMQASMGLIESLTATAHENHFYWLEKFYEAQVQDLGSPPGTQTEMANKTEDGAHEVVLDVNSASGAGFDLNTPLDVTHQQAEGLGTADGVITPNDPNV